MTNRSEAWFPYSACYIVNKLWVYGMSDRAIGIAINRSRVTIHRIRNGTQSGYQCLEDLHTLYKLSRLEER